MARLVDLLREAEHQPTVTTYAGGPLGPPSPLALLAGCSRGSVGGVYEGELGSLQRLLLQGSLVQQELAGDEQRWRDQLARGMAQPGEQVRQINWVLALMPYTRPGC